MAPTVVNVGAVATGTTTMTPAFPAGIAANDILLTVCESVGGQNITVPAGWAHVGPNGSLSSPVVQSTNTQLTVIWRRYDGTGTAPALSGTVDHCIGRMIAIRGCPTTGNPWNVGAVTTEATSDTSVSWPGATTTQADCLILEIVASSADVTPAGTANLGALTNAAYTSITEQMDNNTPTGNGGVIGVVSAVKATAGATGASTATLSTAGFKALMTVAFMNAAPPSNLTAPTVVGTPQTFAFAVDPTTVTYTGGGTGTNLMDVLCVNSDATVATPAGWTLGPSRVVNQGTYIFYRAGGTTTAAIDMASATNTHAIWVRLQDCAGLDTPANANAGVDGTPGTASPAVTSGTLASTRELVVAFAALHNFTTAPTGYVWSSGYTARGSGNQTTGGTAAGGAVATKTPAGTATESPSVTWTNAANDRYMLVAAFAGAAPATVTWPRRMRNHPSLRR